LSSPVFLFSVGNFFQRTIIIWQHELPARNQRQPGELMEWSRQGVMAEQKKPPQRVAF
jgi:hypothetical protein